MFRDIIVKLCNRFKSSFCPKTLLLLHHKNFRISLKIRSTLKISPRLIFKHVPNISITPQISPSEDGHKPGGGGKGASTRGGEGAGADGVRQQPQARMCTWSSSGRVLTAWNFPRERPRLMDWTVSDWMEKDNHTQNLPGYSLCSGLEIYCFTLARLCPLGVSK